jgi:transcriptional regulator with XRE-family HTH domain
MIESTAITRELGARLRECRERAGLRTVDTARNLGWPSSKVSKLESGERKCDPMDLARYLGTCDVPHDEAWSIIRLFHLPETGIWPRPTATGCRTSS